MSNPRYMKVTYDFEQLTEEELNKIGDKVLEDFDKDKVIKFSFHTDVFCQWTEKADRFSTRYETSCGHTQFFNFGNVNGNDFNYCPFCGADIEEVAIND